MISLNDKNISSMYIHIPFCNQICSYCDFTKMLYNSKMVDKYLKALNNEINTFYKDEILSTIYIGGGTPSCLNIDELKTLLKMLSRVKLHSEYEYTFEANWESLSKEKIDLLKQYGVNRVSIGVETSNCNFFTFLNRKLDVDKLLNMINYLKQVGIENINVDLIYALPNETVDDLNKDLDFILSLDVPHISTYSLILEKNTKLYINKTKEIDSELDASMYDNIKRRLKDAGYFHYEISNFSKRGYESKHNLTYWHNERYYGFGLGSSGYLENIRYTNTKSLNDYCLEKYRLEEIIIDKMMDIENEIMLNLRTSEGIDKIRFFQKYGINIEELYDLEKLINQKILLDFNNRIYLDEKYFYVLNSVLVEIFQSIKN